MERADAAYWRYDPKRIHRALFGVFYEEDIYDKASLKLPHVMRAFWWRIDPQMRTYNLIFIHVPRVAGTSVVRALYGMVRIQHHSVRYYRAIDPQFFAAAESFAILRDPLDRFLSAYAFVRNGGTASCRLSEVFRSATAHVTCIDDYLDFLEGAAPEDIDFTMRPQSWFVCDENGAPLVKRFFLYEEERTALSAFLKSHGAQVLPWLNRSDRPRITLSPQQRARIRALYATDFALIAREQAARRAGVAGESAMRVFA